MGIGYELYLYIIILVLSTIIPIIVAVAFFTLSERKIMAYIQRREGPNVVGYSGLLQPLADGLKLLISESIIARQTVPYLFIISATLPLVFSLFQWSIIPIGYYREITNNSSINILYLFPIALGSTYGVVLSGWSSNSRYAVIGSFRSVAQLVSYDIPMLLSLLPVLVASGSLNITEIGYLQSKSIWFFFANIPTALIFFITALAETNRAPFDLPEAEAELVAGFNVEYSAITFALFFLGEYSSMLLMSVLYVQLFFGEDTPKDWIFCFIVSFTALFIVLKEDPFVVDIIDIFIEFIGIFLILYIYINVTSIHIILPYVSIYKSVIYIFVFIKGILYYGYGLKLSFDFNRIFNFLANFLYVIKIPYSLKVVFVCSLFIVTRAITPRYRYDQLMTFCWKSLIPISISMLITSISLLIIFNGFISSF